MVPLLKHLPGQPLRESALGSGVGGAPAARLAAPWTAPLAGVAAKGSGFAAGLQIEELTAPGGDISLTNGRKYVGPLFSGGVGGCGRARWFT